jgi:hypothetical protein
MELQEYETSLKRIKDEFNIKTRTLQTQFGLSQAIFKVDDIIRCMRTETTIKVGAVKVYIGMNGIPAPVYWGYVLKKDLTPKKNGETHSIFGNDQVIKIQ